MVDINTGFWIGFHTEAAYGSGKEAVALGEVILTNTELTGNEVDRMKSCVITWAKPVKEEMYDLPAGLNPTYIQNVKIDPGELTTQSYLQSDDWYDLAISGTQGAIPTAQTLHIDTSLSEKELFGSVVTSWSAEASSGPNAVMQDITTTFRNQKDGSALAKVAFKTGAPSYFKDVSLTIDSLTSANLIVTRVKETITNEVMNDDDGFAIGDEKLQQPVLKKRIVDIEIDYWSRQSNTWGAGYEAAATANELIAASFFNCDIVWGTFLTSAMTNIYLLETNSGERNEYGLIKHTAKFRNGVGFTIA